MNTRSKVVGYDLSTLLGFLVGLLIFLASLWVVRNQRAYLNTQTQTNHFHWQSIEPDFSAKTLILKTQ
jgi:L-lactate permease